jgi:hypothetical protein
MALADRDYYGKKIEELLEKEDKFDWKRNKWGLILGLILILGLLVALIK